MESKFYLYKKKFKLFIIDNFFFKSLLGLFFYILPFNLCAQSLTAPKISLPNQIFVINNTYNVSPTNTGGAVPATNYGLVKTFAGNGLTSFLNGSSTSANFRQPSGVAINKVLKTIYIADAGNNIIRAIDAGGNVSTFCGSSKLGNFNGSAAVSSFNNPAGLAIDNNGNLYVADAGNNLIRKIDQNGNSTTLAGNGQPGSTNGIGTAASFYAPYGIAIDNIGNMYVADAGNNLIRKIVLSTGIVTTVAGNGIQSYLDGIGTSSSFNTPVGVALDNTGNILYIADAGNNRIRKISLSTGNVSTLAGNGSQGFNNDNNADNGITASFYSPFAVITDAAGNVYVADSNNNAIREIIIDPNSGSVTQVTSIAGGGASGTDGTAGSSNGSTKSASFNIPVSLAFDSNYGNIYVADNGNNLIRDINTTNSQVTTYAGGGSFQPGSGPKLDISFTAPNSVITDATGNVYVSDAGNYLIRKIDVSSGNVTTIAGTGLKGATNNTGTSASFFNPSFLAIDEKSNLYVMDNGVLRTINTNGDVNNFIVNMGGYKGIARDGAGNTYVSTIDHVILKIDVNGNVTTLAGVSKIKGKTNGNGALATFSSPLGLASDAAGNVYVADSGNNLIRKIDPSGNVTTLAGSGVAGSINGNGTSASFNNPNSVATDIAGNVYVTDNTNLIRKIDLLGNVTTLAGNLSSGNLDGIGTLASFNQPADVSTDVIGNVYVADTHNNLIRQIVTTGYTISPALPAGLNFDATTGVISGTPNRLSSTQFYTITAYNAAGSSSTTFTLSVINLGITNFKPSSAGAGTTIAIYGSGFTSASAVSFGGTNAKQFTILSDTLITAVVGSGSSGLLSISAAGISFTKSGFLYTPAPNISYPAKQVYSPNKQINAVAPNNIGGMVPSTLFGQPNTYGTILDLAGNGTPGYVNGSNSIATFNYPNWLSFDNNSNYYISDFNNDVVRGSDTLSFNVFTKAGTGVKGSNNGTALQASFNQMQGLAIDINNNIYIADAGNNIIRKIDFNGNVTTFAGSGASGSLNGLGRSASFNIPTGVAIDISGNIYIADKGNNLIRKITPIGQVSTIAGNGIAGYTNGLSTAASFNNPTGIAVDFHGNIYISDLGNNVIRKIDTTGIVTTLAGNGNQGSTNGLGTSASFNAPAGIATDALGNVYIAELGSNLIRKIDITGTVSTLAGGGADINTSFNSPIGVVSDLRGNLLVADALNYAVRLVSTTGYTISPSLPAGLSFDTSTGIITGTPTSLTQATNYTVTAYNIGGSSSNTFSLAIGSSDANLSNLVLNNGKLNPTFNAATYAYTTTLAYADALSKTITITPTVEDPKSTVTVNGVAVSSGSPSAGIPIKVGNNNIISIVVTAENGLQQTYTITVTLNLGIPIINFNTLNAVSYGSADFSPGATVTSPNQPNLPITYTSSDASVATIVNNNIHILATGKTNITAYVQGGGDYGSASPVTQSLTVNKASQSIQLQNLPTKINFEATLDLSTIKASSGLPITIKLTDQSIASLVDDKLVTHKAGIVTLIITQEGDSNYEPTESNYTITVLPGIIITAAVSPNGDGIDDFLLLDGIESFPNNTVTLLSRSGVVIYKASGYNNTTVKFDGHSNNSGNYLPAGTYLYIIEYNNGQQSRLSGNFVLRY
jgi:gliding motility-associated-like protein